MVPYYGDFAEDDTVDMVFNTFTSDDPSASVTIGAFINTDVHIHKDLGVGQRNNAAGITVSVDFDGITGNHAIKIDTSDDTVGGFWVTGSEYQVRIEGTTVDGATINVWVGTFSIERAGGTIALLKLIQAAVITNAAGADVAADIIAIKAETADIVADTNELQADDYPTSIAAIKAETALIVADTNELQTDNIPGTLATIAGYLDTEIAAIVAAVITNAAGTDIAADIIAIKAQAVAIEADTDVIDDGTSGLVKIAQDVAAILVDTGVIGALGAGLTAITDKTDLITAARMGALTDWIDGGRLDLLLDAIKVITDALTAAAATKLALSAGTIVTGTVSWDNTVATTTVFYSDDITEATADHFNGRVIIFTSGALQYQATSISDYALDTGEGKFTVVALTEAPADNVTFLII